MRGKSFIALIALLIASGTSIPAQAGLIGDSVHLYSVFPTSGTIDLDMGTATVGAGIEYLPASFSDRSNAFTLDITNSQIILTYVLTSPNAFTALAFNGFKLSFLTGPSLISVAADISSTFNPVSLSLVGGDLFMDYSGVTVSPGQVSIINVSSAASTSVPEPGTLTLFATALAGLVAVRRRRKARA